MSEDAASSSSSARSRGRSSSPGWSSVQTVERGRCRSVLRTTEKSVVFRVRTEEKLSSSRGRSERRNGSSKQRLRLTQGGDMDRADDLDVHDTLAELFSEAERKKQWLGREEETFRREQERLDSLQREHAALLHSLEQCKRRRKERLRIQTMLRGPQAEGGGYYNERRSSGSDSDNDIDSDGDYNGHRAHRRRSSCQYRSCRDGAKKERKKLRRLQSDVSLRFQLLQSECRRSDLQVEKLVADLRREYADSCLFGNSLNF